MENVGIFCGHLLYYSPFGYVVARKIWQPWNNWRKIEVGRAGFLRAQVGLHTSDLGFCGLANSLNKSGKVGLNLGLGYTKWLKSWASALPTYNGDSLLLWGVENIMIIYLNGSNFVLPISKLSIFTAKCWCHATLPTNFPWIRVYTIYTAVPPIILQ
jgi:hypothetical protein